MREDALRTLVALGLLFGHCTAVLDGFPLDAEHSSFSAVVALWGRPGSAAAGVRCTATFVAPEVVLSAASCVLSRAPSTVLEHAACAYGRHGDGGAHEAVGCPLFSVDDLELLSSSALPERLEVGRIVALDFRYSSPSQMPRVCASGGVCGNGWDVLALRVVQTCPRQRCVPPLPLATSSMLVVGEEVRLAGVGRVVGSSSLLTSAFASGAATADALYVLTARDVPVGAVGANQSVVLPRSVAGGARAVAVAAARAAEADEEKRVT